MVRLTVLFLLVIRPVISFAQGMFVSTQQPSSNVVPASEFLGSSALLGVWDISSDSKGYVYVVVKQQVQRFDGTRLKNMPVKGGLLVGQFQRFSKGANGQLWVFSPKVVARLVGDSLEVYPLPAQLINEKQGAIESFYCDETGTVHLGLKEQGYFKVSPGGEISTVIDASSGMHGFCATRLKDDKLFCFSVRQPGDNRGSGIYLLKDGEPILLADGEMPWPQLQLELTYTIQPSLQAYSDGTVLLSIGDRRIFTIKDQRLVSTEVFEQRVVQLFIDSRDNLWIGTPDKGLYKVVDSDYAAAQNHLPKDIAAVAEEDLHGRLWIYSGEVGFACITHPEMLHYSSENGLRPFDRTYMANVNARGVLCMAPPRGIYVLGDTIRYSPLPKKEHRKGAFHFDENPISSYSYPDSNTLWLGYFGEVASWNGTSWKRYVLDPAEFSNTEVWKLKPMGSGALMGATTDCIFTLKDGVFERISEISDQRITNVIEDNMGTIWVTRMDGLTQLKEGQFVRPHFLKPEELSKPCHSVINAHGALWVQEMNGGSLFCVRGEQIEEVLDPLGEPLRIQLSSISKNGNFWALAKKNDRSHLCKIGLTEGAVEAKFYDIDEDAKKEPFYNSFLATNEAVYIGSSIGFFVAQIVDLKEEESKTEIVLTELRINHKPALLKKEYQLEYNQNYFNLSFDGIHYNRESTEYRYKLAGLDSGWTVAEYQQVQYTNLDPGAYQFEVQARAMKGAGNWSQPVSMDLVIAKPYWETWGFRIAIILLITLLVTIFVIYRVRSVVAKTKIELEMSQLELRALKAQINPHFIFNAMSSATYYLTKNRPDDARSYLVRFSRLIRMVLENSDKSTVPLKEELNMIRQYVSLESEKFEGDGIDFQISLKNEILGEVEIPSALFQPYIENAIWHGLKSKDGKRIIRFNCYQEQEVLYIEIEDNGIGRDAATKVKKEEGHRRSFGMMIASRRIELLNNHNMATVKVDDLHDDNGAATGTRVRFGIPVSARTKSAEQVGVRA